MPLEPIGHRRMLVAPVALAASMIASLVATSGCAPDVYDASRATYPYPSELHLTELPGEDGEPGMRPLVIDMQVFRHGSTLLIINSTAQSYRDVDIWVNQRYALRVDALPAGETVELSLFDFVDEFGGIFQGGGLFRARHAYPVRMVQIQVDDASPLVGLIAIPEGRDG